VAQYAVVLCVTLAVLAYLSVAAAAARGRLSSSLSQPVRLLAWRRRPTTRVNGSAARAYEVFLALLQIVPVGTLLAWWVDYPIAVRLECAGFFVVEAAWLIYLRRFVVRAARTMEPPIG
jgi:hypothetical protein